MFEYWLTVGGIRVVTDERVADRQVLGFKRSCDHSKSLAVAAGHGAEEILAACDSTVPGLLVAKHVHSVSLISMPEGSQLVLDPASIEEIRRMPSHQLLSVLESWHVGARFI